MAPKTCHKNANANYLDYVPVRTIQHETGNDDGVVLLRPKFMSGILAKYFQPHIKHQYYKVRLDEIGSTTWRAIDGVRTVGEIADMLRQSFGDRVEPPYERCSRFINSLHQGKMVTFDTSKSSKKE